MRRAALLLLLAPATVVAGEGDAAPEAEVRTKRKGPKPAFRATGHVKTFGLVSIGQPVEGLPDDLVHDVLNPLPDTVTGQGLLDGRLNLSLAVGRVRVEAAHAVTVNLDGDSGADASNAEVVAALQADGLGALGDMIALGEATGGLSGGGGGGGPFSSGVGLRAPEAFPLTWRVGFDPQAPVSVQGRTDRLLVKVALKGFDVTLGRQPVSFGSGLFFTPLDLINPFTPATIDSEYKPGVDALRLDGFFGTSGQVTVVAAWTGSTFLYEAPAEGESSVGRVALAGQGRFTVGVTDLAIFLGGIRGDFVAGLSLVSSAGPVGLHGDVTVTVPRPDLEEPVFARAVVGIDGRPTGTTTLSGEVYVQSFGTTDPSQVFTRLSRERAARGEVWLSGLAYAGVAVTQEITPLLVGSLGAFVNLTDPSALLAPSISWSAAQSVDVALGGYVGLGARPIGREIDLGSLPDVPTATDLAVIVPRSELGTYPATIFLKVAAYF